MKIIDLGDSLPNVIFVICTFLLPKGNGWIIDHRYYLNAIPCRKAMVIRSNSEEEVIEYDNKIEINYNEKMITCGDSHFFNENGYLTTNKRDSFAFVYYDKNYDINHYNVGGAAYDPLPLLACGLKLGGVIFHRKRIMLFLLLILMTKIYFIQKCLLLMKQP